MQIEFIYTFETGRYRQSAVKTMFVSELLASPELLARFALSEFEQKDRRNSVVKISSLVYLNGDTCKFPDWYIECSGKLYFKDGKLLE